jgi:plastocyanin
VDVENNGAEPHALEIEGGGQEWRSDLIQPGESVTMSLVLAPGTYHVYCPLASGGESHADRGMKTILRVR